MKPFRLLILGGTGEARELTERITARFGDQVTIVYSLAGRTDAPLLPSCDIRRGGFGGVEGLAAHLRSGDYHAVVDATHPFADRISRNASAACDAAGIRSVTLARPAWHSEAGDTWRSVSDFAAAAIALRNGCWTRAFVTSGRTGLEAFAPLRGIFVLVRLIANPSASVASTP